MAGLTESGKVKLCGKWEGKWAQTEETAHTEVHGGIYTAVVIDTVKYLV